VHHAAKQAAATQHKVLLVTCYVTVLSQRTVTPVTVLQGWGAGTDTLSTAVMGDLAPATTYFYKYGSEVR
jgi:hypothetical protein